MKRPREYTKKPYQYACASPSFVCEDGKIPASLFINCDGVNLKDAKKIKAWLEKAIKWLEVQK
jgi:hypothetical protein